MNLIKCLAEYEKQPEAVIINEKTIIEDGFGQFPLFGCVLAERENDKKIVGMALYYYMYLFNIIDIQHGKEKHYI